MEELRRQMTCTRAEFMSWLPGATRHARARVDGNTVTILVGSGCVEITLEEAAPRRAGRMCLPTLHVTMHFRGLDEETRGRFIAYFDLYTRRGGG
jgi:hypothetical protein